MNNLNMLSVSEYFEKFFHQLLPNTLFPVRNFGSSTNWQMESIYIGIFFLTLREPNMEKGIVFWKANEGVLKYVERFFGVLFPQLKFCLGRLNCGNLQRRLL